MKKLKLMLLIGLIALSMGLYGCAGDDGTNGVNGVDGAPGADGADAVATHIDESCNVCHGAGQQIGLSIDTLHPLVDPKIIIEDIVVASVAGTGDTVTFNAFEEDGTTPVLGLTIADFRFYIADLVPAGTTTTTTFTLTTAPVTTWETIQPERWLYERSSTAGAVLTENGGGSYTYTFVADIAVGDTALAPEFNIAHTQRLMIRHGGTELLSREAAIVEFVIPADGDNTGVLSQDETTFSRAIVMQEACTTCHGDPLQSAAHGSSYQTPQGCVVCHTPIGNEYGDEMQADGAWLARLIHNIHAASATGTAWDWSEVTYPKFIQECSTCHFDAGQAQADVWKTNPTAETCTTCHDVTFTGAAPTHSGGAMADNSLCAACHPATGTGVGQSIEGAHAVDYDRDNLAYNVTISISPDANTDGVYEVGEAILVTATVDTPGFDYLNADTTFLRSATLYVYGPRAKAVPVLTPGSTTDPDYLDPLVTPAGTPPDQGRNLLDSTDVQVLTDATGFKYQLLPITADMAAGTYMIQTNLDISLTGDRATDGRHIGPRLYPLDGWELVNFQVGTATPELKVAGECNSCHDQRNFSTYAHRSYFGTDGCLACHDQSGNHADPIVNRVHAVHSATTAGDLTNVPGETPSRVWDEITFPRSLNSSCAACHNSGNDSHRDNPGGSWGFACIGCHADTVGARAHMETNGAPFPVH